MGPGKRARRIGNETASIALRRVVFLTLDFLHLLTLAVVLAAAGAADPELKWEANHAPCLNL
jgi:hypothetical protein